MNTFSLDRPWGWRERWKAKFFPFIPCELPEAPASFQDVIITKSKSVLSWKDLMRVIITRKIEVETRIVCENPIGNHKSASVIRCGRFS